MVSVEGPARKQLQRLQEALAQVSATGEPEAIHHARVACRRLNELLDLMAAWLDGETVRRVRRSLKRMRRAFQQVRDEDVLLDSLSQGVTRGSLETHEMAQLEGELTRRREKELDRALGKCRRLQARAVLDEVERLCEMLEKAAVDERAALKNRLEEMFRERSAAMLECDSRHSETSNLHEDRIRLKRLRYVVELIRQFELGLSDELVGACAHMQETLGRWHDHLVAADTIGCLARRRRVSYGQTAWAARLLDYASFRLGLAEEDRWRVLAEWPVLERELRAAELPQPAELPEADDERAAHINEAHEHG
jgi:CHAD domain-containing protein